MGKAEHYFGRTLGFGWPFGGVFLDQFVRIPFDKILLLGMFGPKLGPLYCGFLSPAVLLGISPIEGMGLGFWLVDKKFGLLFRLIGCLSIVVTSVKFCIGF